MNFLNSDIGSAKDNYKIPIHNWYKFTAGFSYRFVDEIICKEKLGNKKHSQIFDPFAGCGTTLVSSQKLGISSIGNEAQEFMCDIIRAKLNWDLKLFQFEHYLSLIKEIMIDGFGNFYNKNIPHSLLKSLYTKETLAKLYLIRNAVLSIKSKKYSLFFKLALSQTLHKVSLHPIAVPYISRNKKLSQVDKPWEFFEKICRQMYNDTLPFSKNKKSCRIYLQDSRFKNRRIEDDECNLCITSPPYLNNLDYGEVSKVHSHFFEITNSWNDITNVVRKNLVTGSTTHYSKTDFVMEKFKNSEFYINNPKIAEDLISTSEAIKDISDKRTGKKSFDILILLYFRDMYSVLKEIRRVVKKKNKTYLILGDSAPYGVHVKTTEILGKISRSLGYNEHKIIKIRTRGTKWKSLRHRHSLELSENVLILR